MFAWCSVQQTDFFTLQPRPTREYAKNMMWAPYNIEGKKKKPAAQECLRRPCGAHSPRAKPLYELRQPLTFARPGFAGLGSW